MGSSLKFNFENAQFDYEPYPICYIPNFFAAEDYRVLSESYPDLSLFKFQESLGNKYSLAEFNNGDKYFEFLKQNKCWNDFFNTIKTKEFIEQVLSFLKQHNIDFGYKDFKYTPKMKVSRNRLGLFRRPATMRSRFEFAVMKADGGNILPHTDAKQKVITIVLSMIKPGEWNKEWHGGTDVVLPKDRTKIYNQVNKQSRFEDVDVIKEFPFDPNQAVLFIKTYNSWHSVSPMTGPDTALRKTVTINIDKLA